MLLFLLDSMLGAYVTIAIVTINIFSQEKVIDYLVQFCNYNQYMYYSTLGAAIIAHTMSNYVQKLTHYR